MESTTSYAQPARCTGRQPHYRAVVASQEGARRLHRGFLSYPAGRARLSCWSSVFEDSDTVFSDRRAGIGRSWPVESPKFRENLTPGYTSSEQEHLATRESVGRRPWAGDYPPTKGRAGGKLPVGKATLRSPAFSFSAACRKAATNQAYPS